MTVDGEKHNISLLEGTLFELFFRIGRNQLKPFLCTNRMLKQVTMTENTHRRGTSGLTGLDSTKK